MSVISSTCFGWSNSLDNSNEWRVLRDIRCFDRLLAMLTVGVFFLSRMLFHRLSWFLFHFFTICYFHCCLSFAVRLTVIRGRYNVLKFQITYKLVKFYRFELGAVNWNKTSGVPMAFKLFFQTVYDCGCCRRRRSSLKRNLNNCRL